MKWLTENVSNVNDALAKNDLMIGTVDTCELLYLISFLTYFSLLCYLDLLWNLTGGCNGGIYITDATNASRTQLMDLNSLEWDAKLLSFFELPFGIDILPKIVSSCEIYGKLSKTSIKVPFHYIYVVVRMLSLILEFVGNTNFRVSR